MSEVAISNDRLHYTYKDYLTWPENERWELIDGVPLNMTPAPSTEHQRLVLELAFILKLGLEDSNCTVYIAPFDVRLPFNDNTDEETVNVVQPDIVVICDRSKIDTKGCKGAPDLVIEITSPSTFRKDLTDKYLLYEKSGVKEYWIVYPENKAMAIYTLEDKKFGLPQVFTAEDTINVNLFSGLIVDLSKVFLKS